MDRVSTALCNSHSQKNFSDVNSSSFEDNDNAMADDSEPDDAMI